MRLGVGVIAGVVLLVGCAAEPRRVEVPKGPAPADMALVDPTPGFNDREPDTCKGASVAVLVGQPVGNVRTVVMPGPYRVVAPGQVVDQNEYRSDRVNLFVDAAGMITRIGCG